MGWTIKLSRAAIVQRLQYAVLVALLGLAAPSAAFAQAETMTGVYKHEDRDAFRYVRQIGNEFFWLEIHRDQDEWNRTAPGDPSFSGFYVLRGVSLDAQGLNWTEYHIVGSASSNLDSERFLSTRPQPGSGSRPPAIIDRYQREGRSVEERWLWVGRHSADAPAVRGGVDAPWRPNFGWLRREDDPLRDVTGLWMGDDQGLYRIQQFEDGSVVWFGEQLDSAGQPHFANIFIGRRSRDSRGDYVAGRFVDIPRGRTRGAGELRWRINGEFELAQEGRSGFGGRTLTRLTNHTDARPSPAWMRSSEARDAPSNLVTDGPFRVFAFNPVSEADFRQNDCRQEGSRGASWCDIHETPHPEFGYIYLHNYNYPNEENPPWAVKQCEDEYGRSYFHLSSHFQPPTHFQLFVDCMRVGERRFFYLDDFKFAPSGVPANRSFSLDDPRVYGHLPLMQQDLLVVDGSGRNPRRSGPRITAEGFSFSFDHAYSSVARASTFEIRGAWRRGGPFDGMVTDANIAEAQLTARFPVRFDQANTRFGVLNPLIVFDYIRFEDSGDGSTSPEGETDESRFSDWLDHNEYTEGDSRHDDMSSERTAERVATRYANIITGALRRHNSKLSQSVDATFKRTLREAGVGEIERAIYANGYIIGWHAPPETALAQAQETASDQIRERLAANPNLASQRDRRTVSATAPLTRAEVQTAAPRQPRTRRFENPRVTHEGRAYRIDACRVWANDCGQPAADRFCQLQGYAEATGFGGDRDVGARTPTLVIDDRRVCDQPACDSFSYIVCEGAGQQ